MVTGICISWMISKIEYKILKNWCTVTVAPTIEHHGGHSRTPANQRWDLGPGGVSVSCLASRTRHECLRNNESLYMDYIDSTEGCSKLIRSAEMISPGMHVLNIRKIQVPNGKGPGVRWGKRCLLVSRTSLKWPMKTSRN